MMSDIENALNLLTGKPCWGVLSGFPNGSIIELHFGDKIARHKTIMNKNLPHELNEYIGEYQICVACTWRLQLGNTPITGSCEPNNLDGPLVMGLKKIVGRLVTSIKLTDPCGDLCIYFDSLYIKIFCNFTGNEDQEYCFQDEANWYLRHYKKKNILEVKRGCILVFDKMPLVY